MFNKTIQSFTKATLDYVSLNFAVKIPKTISRMKSGHAINNFLGDYFCCSVALWAMRRRRRQLHHDLALEHRLTPDLENLMEVNKDEGFCPVSISGTL